MRSVSLFLADKTFNFHYSAFSLLKTNVQQLNLGVLLENKDQEFAFDYAADLINTKGNINFKFNLVKASIEPDNPFSAFKGVCSLLKGGVIAIFGPTSPSNIDVVHSVCSAKLIPYIYTDLSSPASRKANDSIKINVYHSSLLTQSFTTIMEYLGWQDFTLLYTRNDRLRWLEEYIDEAKRAGLVVNMVNLDVDPDGFGDFRLVIEEITKFHQRNFILDCDAMDLTILLRQMRGLGILTSDYKYLLTNPHVDANVLQSFANNGANIYKIRLINLSYGYVLDNELILSRSKDSRTAVILDAFIAISSALKYAYTPRASFTPNSNMDCYNTEKWAFHQLFINFFSSGHKFYNTELNLDMFNPSGVISEMMGKWYHTHGFVPILRNNTVAEGNKTEIVDDISFINFRVMTTLLEPYTMWKISSHKLSGNNQFEGYTIDLLDALSKIENFTYTIVIREDGRNGFFNPFTGRWNGIIQDLLEHRADLAVTDMTITSDRETAVDFTVPFMHFGIGVLFQKPLFATPSFWYFAKPFSKDFWLATALAFVAVALCLFVIGRLSPSEWQKTCNKSHYIVNHLTFSNSLWLAAGGLFKQGTHVKVSSVPARIIAVSWWCFCYILIAAYTASLFFNLYLNEYKKVPLFTTWQDMVARARDLDIQYGAKLGGSTEDYFKMAQDPLYKDIYRHMYEHREEMVPTIADGIERAKRTKYALFMESTAIEYITNKHCDLEMYGGLLSQSAYGIAMRKESPYRHALSTAILKLQASGELDKLKRKWWNDEACKVSTSEKLVISPLGISEFSGPIYITLAGLILAVLGAFLEFSYYIYKLSRRIKISFCRTFTYEMKKCFTVNVKKVVDSNLIDTPIPEDENDPVSEAIELFS